MKTKFLIKDAKTMNRYKIKGVKDYSILLVLYEISKKHSKILSYYPSFFIRISESFRIEYPVSNIEDVVKFYKTSSKRFHLYPVFIKFVDLDRIVKLHFIFFLYDKTKKSFRIYDINSLEDYRKINYDIERVFYTLSENYFKFIYPKGYKLENNDMISLSKIYLKDKKSCKDYEINISIDNFCSIYALYILDFLMINEGEQKALKDLLSKEVDREIFCSSIRNYFLFLKNELGIFYGV